MIAEGQAKIAYRPDFMSARHRRGGSGADGVLRGLRIVVTRPQGQAKALTRALEELGAEVTALPTIRVAPPADPRPLRASAGSLKRYDWIVFTSANGVAFFWEALRHAGLEADALGAVRIAAVGPATAAAIEARGGRVDLVPPVFVAESVAISLSQRTLLSGKRILLPRAQEGRQALPTALRAAGAHVEEVVAYRTIADTSAAQELIGLFSSGGVDMVVFASGSAVRSFVKLVGRDLGAVEVASIGPTTSAVVREVGLPVTIEARIQTAAGLVDAIRMHVAGERNAG